MFGIERISFGKQEVPKSSVGISETTEPKFLKIQYAVDRAHSTAKVSLIENGIAKLPSFVSSKQSQKISESSDNETIESNSLDTTLSYDSEDSLLAQIQKQFESTFNTEKTTANLTKKGLSQEQINQTLQEVFLQMSEKTLSTFKKAQVAELTSKGLTNEQAQQYTDWKLNNLSQPQTINLIQANNTELLVSADFISDSLIEEFQQTANSQPATPEILTTDAIDNMLEELSTS